MNLAFLGAAGTVTGSKTLVTHEGKQVLVDCGLFQGYKNLRLMNWEQSPSCRTSRPACKTGCRADSTLPPASAPGSPGQAGARGRHFARVANEAWFKALVE